METTKEKEHLLALKVMRLTRPSMFCTLPVTFDSRDLSGNVLNHEVKSDIASFAGEENFMLGNLLMLPQSFGNIYLGETFTSYISVNNDSNQSVRDVSIKADLQTSSQKISLTGHSTATELAPNHSVDDVINHEVKEIGTHILVCAVSYTTDSNEKMYFRKFFKFQVMKPLDVKTKFYNAESDEVYLEAQVQNITKSTLCLEKVSFEPSSLFEVSQLNHVETKDGVGSIFGRVNCIHQQDSRQFLYCLTPRKELLSNPKALKGGTNIGKLDIVWRNSMGDRGRLQTSQLQRMAPGYGDIRLTVQQLTNVVVIQQHFSFTCRIINCCERKLDLLMSLDSKCNSGLSWNDVSGRAIGKLEPDEFLDVSLNLLPVQLGLQSISGIRLTDTFLKRTYDYDDLAQIYVTDDKTNSPIFQQ
ncbi:hypothetical protein CHUAL_006262 [Chamberlinius hualienensis]